MLLAWCNFIFAPQVRWDMEYNVFFRY